MRVSQPERRVGLKLATEPLTGTKEAGVKAEAVASAATQRRATFIIVCNERKNHRRHRTKIDTTA